MRFNTIFTGVLLVLASISAARANQQVYEKTLKSTAWIVIDKAEGSGVVVDGEKRWVLTNYHVVGEAGEVTVVFPFKEGGHTVVEKKTYRDKLEKIGLKGKVIAVDRRRDLALVELPSLPEGTIPVALAEQSVSPGAAIHSVGNQGSSQALWVYTSGTVRAVIRKSLRTESGGRSFTAVETQSPVNQGDSGGPVVDDEGRLVALVQSFSPQDRLVSTCIDISEIKGFLSGDRLPSIVETFERTGLKYGLEKSIFKIEFRLDESRKQSVFVSQGILALGKAEVREVWAPLTKTKEAPSAALLMDLMKRNTRTKTGAWALEQSQENEFVLYFSTKIDAGATPDMLRSSLEYVAVTAGNLTKELAGNSPTPNNQTAKSTVANPKKDWFGGK